MRLPDDFEEEENHGSNKTLLYAVTVSAALVVMIILVVLSSNGYFQKSKRNVDSNTNETNSMISDTVENATENTIADFSDGKVRPSDFDFWDMYPKEEQVSVNNEPEITQEEPAEELPDPSTDGKHTLIEYADGETEWILINPYIEQNPYDFTNLKNKDGIMEYTSEGKKISHFGVDISKIQEYVDFQKLKKAGVEYVMIRLGARGYGNGSLIEDDYFIDNMKRASDAGLKIGVYFFSQAISVDEAVEEANFVIERLQGYDIEYPIAYDMEYIENDSARVEDLSREEKTQITIAFLDRVKEAGYTGVLYGNKEWLLKKLNFTLLAEYDIWLSQCKDVPDFPYRFTMWQYSKTSQIEGIAGNANLNISFIDYSEK